MNTKRNTLKKVAGISAIAIVAPSSWTKPILNSVVLPAHAQTSTLISNPEIDGIGVISINDNGGFTEVTVTTITGNEILSGAVFSIVTPINGLFIDAVTGVLTFQGDVGGNQTYTITVRVVNLDTGEDTETFTLNVTDQL